MRLTDCAEFYRAILESLGYALAVDEAAKKGFCCDGRYDFWLVEGETNKDVHFAFTAQNRAVVDKVYARVDGHGGVRDRAPALASHIHPNYYAGYARDPDGRLVEFVSHTDN